MAAITDVETVDVRFPTSRHLDGSDAMNPDPDYSAAFVILGNGVNENLAILLLAAAFGKPVCPHAGGVGLCELVQHLAMFDFVAVSRSLTVDSSSTSTTCTSTSSSRSASATAATSPRRHPACRPS